MANGNVVVSVVIILVSSILAWVVVSYIGGLIGLNRDIILLLYTIVIALISGAVGFHLGFSMPHEQIEED